MTIPRLLLSSLYIALFSSAVQAQTPAVTLYGTLDIGYQYSKERSDRALNGLSSGQQSGSVIGVTGLETLGTHLYTQFKLEAGFDSDTGISNGNSQLFNEESWLGLGNTSWGEIRIGRQKTITNDFATPIDPFQNSFANAGFSNVAIFSGQSMANMIRFDEERDGYPGFYQTSFTNNDSLDLSKQSNSIKYLSPNWNGWQFGANYSFNPVHHELAGSHANPRAYGAAVQYQRDAWTVMLSYDRLNNADYSTGTQRLDGGYGQAWQLGGTYDFSIIKLHAAYVNQKFNASEIGLFNTQRPIAPDGSSLNIKNEDEDLYLVGLSASLAGGEIFGSYYASSKTYLRSVATNRLITANGIAYNDKAKAQSWQIGYSYPLSKRSNLYTYFAQSSNMTARISEDTHNDTRLRTFGVGLRHNF